MTYQETDHHEKDNATMKTAVLSCLLLSGLAVANAVAAEPAGDRQPAWTGYRGPGGTGVFPDSNPPTDCDLKE